MKLQPIQQLAIIKRKHLIITLGVFFSGLWLALLGYLLFGNKPSQHVDAPVAVRSASPTLGSTPTMTSTTPHFGRIQMSKPSANVQQTPIRMPRAEGAGMQLYMTSRATMKSVGGGGGNGVAVTNGKGGGRKGISYGGNMVMISAALPLATPGSGRANDIAQVIAEPQAKPGLKKVEGPPEIPFPDPVGDVTWGLIALLALAYAGTLYYRRRKAA